LEFCLFGGGDRYTLFVCILVKSMRRLAVWVFSLATWDPLLFDNISRGVSGACQLLTNYGLKSPTLMDAILLST
jgi:hypothetical protein